MKVYTCTSFFGHWPVGTAAVIIAADKTEAKEMLETALNDSGLPQIIEESDFTEISKSTPSAHILNNGDY